MSNSSGGGGPVVNRKRSSAVELVRAARSAAVELSAEDEEKYLRLSVHLLQSLQRNEVVEAIAAAEAIRELHGGKEANLPIDCPARLLLTMKDAVLARAHEDEESDDADEASEATSSSESESGEDDGDEEEESEEDSESDVHDDAAGLAMREADSSPALVIDVLRSAVEHLPPMPTNQLAEADEEDEPTEEDEEVDAEIEGMMNDVQKQVDREMQRLSIIRKHR